jgi:hypothetical protein
MTEYLFVQHNSSAGASDGDFVGRVLISKNIADDVLVTHIRMAQDRYLKPLLGVKFYTELQTAMEDGTYTPEEVALVDDFIKPFLVFKTMIRYVPENGMSDSAHGYSSKNTDNADVVTEKRRGELGRLYEEDALYYERQLVFELRKNWKNRVSVDRYRNGNIGSVHVNISSISKHKCDDNSEKCKDCGCC